MGTGVVWVTMVSHPWTRLMNVASTMTSAMTMSWPQDYATCLILCWCHIPGHQLRIIQLCSVMTVPLTNHCHSKCIYNIVQRHIVKKSNYRTSEEEGSQCSCQTCMCDLQLATCLHATGKCPSPLFGILNRRKRKWEKLVNLLVLYHPIE